MIIQVNEPEYANIFATIYNSANTLFDDSERYDASGEIFIKQLKDDTNFIYLDEEQKIRGFMSFHKIDRYYELTSLYVERKYQKEKIGYQLLTHFEKQAGKNTILFIKVLKNAYWALNFYQKNGYEFLNDEIYSIITSLGIIEKSWEKILYKKIVP